MAMKDDQNLRYTVTPSLWPHDGYTSKIKLFNCLKSVLEAFSCKHCDYETDCTVCFKEHTSIHKPLKENEKRSCKKCKLETSDRSIWQKHRKNCSLYYCQLCDYGTSVRETLKIHIILKHGHIVKHRDFGEEFNPKLCSSTVNKQSEKHKSETWTVRKQSSENSNWFNCDKCPYKTPVKYYLDKHILSHHLLPEKWFRCNRCSYKCKGQTNKQLQTHVASHPRSFKCDKCSYETKLKFHLQKHVTAHHMSSESTDGFKCDKCPFETKRKDYLKRHYASKHTSHKEFWFCCDKCCFETKAEGRMRRHINSLSHKKRLGIKLEVMVMPNNPSEVVQVTKQIHREFSLK